MKFFSDETQKKLRNFFEKSGILFPKGKRDRVERRSGEDRRLSNEVDYLAVDGDAEERRGYSERRDSAERRDDKKDDSPLDGML